MVVSEATEWVMKSEPVHAEDSLPTQLKLHNYLQSPNLLLNSGNIESKSNSIFKYDSLLSQYISTFQCCAGSFLILCWAHLARSQLLLHFLWTWIPSLQPFSGSFTAPWSSMLQSSEQYCLAWESKYLMELGNALDSLLNGFVNMMAQEALKFTVLSGKNLNVIRSAQVALVQFHCWCLFKGAFLNKEDFWEDIFLGSIGTTLQMWPENLLCHTCNLRLLSRVALPLCHWLVLLKLHLETPPFTCDFISLCYYTVFYCFT